MRYVSIPSELTCTCSVMEKNMIRRRAHDVLCDEVPHVNWVKGKWVGTWHLSSLSSVPHITSFTLHAIRCQRSNQISSPRLKFLERTYCEASWSFRLIQDQHPKPWTVSWETAVTVSDQSVSCHSPIDFGFRPSSQEVPQMPLSGFAIIWVHTDIILDRLSGSNPLPY